MELICLGSLTLAWLRVLARANTSLRSTFISSIVLAFLSWIVIIQLIGIVLQSVPLTLAGAVSLLILGLIWPGGRFVRILERRVPLR